MARFYSKKRYKHFSFADWTAAVRLGIGLNEETVLSILAQRRLSFEEDGIEKCTAALLQWGKEQRGKMQN
jgi:hypothetical protein